MGGSFGSESESERERDDGSGFVFHSHLHLHFHSSEAPNIAGWGKLPPLIAVESCFPYGAVTRIRFEGFSR